MSGAGVFRATRRHALLLAGAATGIPLARATPRARMEVWKDPFCGCCTGWIAHMRAAGFEVVAHDTDDLGAVKRANGVPAALSSCHTALVEGYVVEGHIPAPVTQRLLENRPAIRGIVLPGMPSGSPGMDGPKAGPFVIYALPRGGEEPVVHAIV